MQLSSDEVGIFEMFLEPVVGGMVEFSSSANRIEQIDLET